MGRFRIVIEGVGNHGCAREKGKGDSVSQHERCGSPGCVDCAALSAVNRLRESNSLQVARIEHWPGERGQVVDDLLTGVRDADFPERIRALNDKEQDGA